MRNTPPFRGVPWVMLLHWLLNMFVTGILALERGVDPVRAAEAVKTLAPTAGTPGRMSLLLCPSVTRADARWPHGD